MKRLIVDDARNWRGDNAETITVRSYEEAVPLFDEDWDEIWLDHDLAEEKTGYDLALALRDALAFRSYIPAIFIHTMNPIGAERMTDALSCAGYHSVRVPITQLLRYFDAY